MQIKSDAERFRSFVEITADCWIWLGGRTPKGYGVFALKGKSVGAHQWAYRNLRGPIPDGLELDHLCRNTSCVNPAHLEIVTHGENLRRGTQYHRSLTACKRGHPFNERNTYCRPDGARQCRICHNARSIAWWARHRAKETAMSSERGS